MSTATTESPTALDMRWTLSNGLSALRGVMAIPLAWMILNEMRTAAIVLSIAASLTDILDGYLARRLNEVSDLGKIIDPLADKVYVAVGVIALLIVGWIPLWFVVLVLARDLLIFIGGVLIERRTGVVLPSNYWGKAAVVCLAITAIVILAAAGQGVIAFFMALSVIMLVLSFGIYLVRGVQVLTGRSAA